MEEIAGWTGNQRDGGGQRLPRSKKPRLETQLCGCLIAGLLQGPNQSGPLCVSRWTLGDGSLIRRAINTSSCHKVSLSACVVPSLQKPAASIPKPTVREKHSTSRI